ncbi:uncharacterized protein KD926_004184 [Aspergillus affinis]|uniref:uncharacterized protein n=1 Tax=Aspergillus affinis TaxID=1070780 RepID=UPI0022FE4E4A|nr:uncharacterized protein KD926_004184 [Aspergillus affinis]KAI9046345.1 hypothetical protein KD926_004184 [Aspergillus affinis]
MAAWETTVMGTRVNVGPVCSPTSHVCTGPRCRVVSCTGRDCKNGICTGKHCQPEDSDCENKEAASCTNWISSSLVKPASTYLTNTVTTACKTITAYNAEVTTATKTVDKDGFVEFTVTIIDKDETLDTTIEYSLSSDISAYYSVTGPPLTLPLHQLPLLPQPPAPTAAAELTTPSQTPLSSTNTS